MSEDTELELHKAAIALGAIYKNRPESLSYLSRPGYEYWMTSLEPPHRWKWSKGEQESSIWLEWHRLRGLDPHKRRSNRLRPRLREAVIVRDGYICGLCDMPVAPDDVHIDHIQPRARGGSDGMENLQVAHSRCNLRKGARL